MLRSLHADTAVQDIGHIQNVINKHDRLNINTLVNCLIFH